MLKFDVISDLSNLDYSDPSESLDWGFVAFNKGGAFQFSS